MPGILVAFSLAMLILWPIIIPNITFAKSPYQSGYDHGCDDARISSPSQQYLNQPEKGPSYHTSEFMDGYYSGISSCGGNSGSNSYQEPQQSGSNQGFKETLNECKEDFSAARGLSDTIDTVLGGACIVAGGLSEITK